MWLDHNSFTVGKAKENLYYKIGTCAIRSNKNLQIDKKCIHVTYSKLNIPPFNKFLK